MSRWVRGSIGSADSDRSLFSDLSLSLSLSTHGRSFQNPPHHTHPQLLHPNSQNPLLLSSLSLSPNHLALLLPPHHHTRPLLHLHRRRRRQNRHRREQHDSVGLRRRLARKRLGLAEVAVGLRTPAAEDGHREGGSRGERPRRPEKHPEGREVALPSSLSVHHGRFGLELRRGW